MIKFLTGKHQKKVAWSLLFIFYGEFVGSAFAFRGTALNIVNPRTTNVPTVFFTSDPVQPGTFVGSFTKKDPALVNNDLVATMPEAIPLSDDEVKNENEEEPTNDIGGPGQPEMSSFKSVGADNMVNLFTGDFSYNIPLLDVGGYPVNLFYNAGITMDQEASWVGLGWNINPGTISRNMRGLPDDYNGSDVVTRTQSMKPDVTVGVAGATGKELIGVPAMASSNLSINAGIFYNNKRGIGLEGGVDYDYSPLKAIKIKSDDEKAMIMDTIPKWKISGSVSLNSQNGLSVNGGFAMYKYLKESQVNTGLSTATSFNSREGITGMSISAEINRYKLEKCKEEEGYYAKNSSFATPTASLSFARPSYTPAIRMPLTTVNQFYSVKLGREQKVLFKNGTVSGYLNETKIAKSDEVQAKPAYGYMYYEKGTDNENALLDFNRMQDGVYTLRKPVISIPTYTYDVFSISGEGTGGTFRGYRGNMGYVRDNDTRTRTSGLTVSLDLGPGRDLFHGGTILGGAHSTSDVNEWKDGNALRYNAKFNTSKADYQGFYFRNPGEQAIVDEAYYNKLGGDQLVRPYLQDIHSALPMLASGFQVFGDDGKVSGTVQADGTSKRNTRDKRTQVITYLTAEEADLVGLDRNIYSFKENTFLPGSCNTSVRTPIKRWNPGDNGFFYRKGNHLSEIDVLEADGRRYVYGIPVYTIRQKEVTFSIETNQGNAVTQQATYTDQQNSRDNNSGQDGLYDCTETNGYAHSFLLSGILSPDYMDVTGDGITDDDKGTAIKFNYSRVNMKKSLLLNAWTPYRWKMPAYSYKANYNEGLKANPKDDMGLFTYGEKELWYMHSIESKNMVATFYISDRRDGNPVAGENGGLDIKAGRTLQKKLDSINLYTKADYAKYGAGARPIKTVHFDYDYTLCPDYALNDGAAVTNNGNNINQAKGKLTLKAIWFSYNGNSNQVKNKYKFKYSTTNPSYNSAENDRWGNYKSHSQNPEKEPGVRAGNNDYPYTLQNASLANAYASAWNLEKILLPGGSVVEVQYEADEYAFVQNKRSSQMSVIAGFGNAPNSTPSNTLYTLNMAHVASPGKMDHRFVFFDVPQALANRNEIAGKYLQDIKQLLLRLWVKMPRGNVGEDIVYEPVTIYGAIKDYNFAINPATGAQIPTRFYVELQPTSREGSPIMETVMQFLKDQLPSRAYPGFAVKQDNANALVQLVRAVYGMMNSLFQGVMGFEKDMKIKGKCREVRSSMSFARLNNPEYKKIGGGHRIKQVMINDNWNRMTGQYESYYGQLYDYTTTEEVNGQVINISSGVASYEPGIGNEENPFREVLSYSDKQFLGPTDHNNIELPLAEMFFPSPMIGYGKVSVRSIHNKDNKNIKSGVGLQQTEFYTSRDFPVFSDFTPFDEYSRQHHKPRPLQKVFNFDKRDYMTLTQGVRVVLNDMNGKLKSQTSYAENDLKTPINFSGYYYRLTPTGNNTYKLDNKVRAISGPDGKISDKLVGRDVEVMNDFREHLSYTRSANIPLNVDLFRLGTFPVIIPTIFRMIFRDKSLYRAATTLKVVNEYGIIDSVVNIDKGSVVGTKNLVFDAETGGVLISRTNNEFKKPVYQFNYPAWWVNSGMEPAYKNIDVVYDKVLFRNGRIEESSHVSMDLFESGDEILVIDKSAKGVIQSPGCVALGDPPLLPLSSEHRIWAVDIRKDIRNATKEFIFIDRHGNPYNAADASIRIIRSGKRNMTSVSAGSIVSLNSPIRTYTYQGNTLEHVVIDNNTDVINAGAAEFREKWRTNEMFYAKDTTLLIPRLAPVRTTKFFATNYHLLGGFFSLTHATVFCKELLKSLGMGLPILFGNTNFFEAAMQRRGIQVMQGNDYQTTLLYDFSSINTSATILSAKLSLFAHRLNAPGNSHQIFNLTHEDNRPHNEVSYVPRPGFNISALRSPWYAATSTAWNNVYPISTSDPVHSAYVRVDPSLPYQNKDFALSPLNDERIEMTDIVKKMIIEHRDPSKQYATAIRIDVAEKCSNTFPIETRRYCFTTGINAPNDPRSSFMEIKHYDCAEAYGLPGNPASPPPGQETIVCANTAVTGTFCFSSFSKHQMNPYVEGVIGNWRASRSYVYYGERRESDPAIATDIRKDGIIKDFEPYWALDNNNIQLGKTNSTRWVWNSEITQYNRKGAELEDHDPLNRYNAGIYGYQESLPVAVISNSRLRLSAFDGFEDYYYKDDPCEPFCKPSKRHFPTGITTSMLRADTAHTGKYSVRVDEGSTYTVDVKISPDDPEITPDILIKLDKTPVQQVVQVKPKGIGLKGYYYNDPTWGGNPTQVIVDPRGNQQGAINLAFKKGNHNGCDNRDWDDPPDPVRCYQMSIRWIGRIQVVTSGYYEFMSVNADDEAYVHINGNHVATDVWGGAHTRTPVYLTAGTLHTIQVDFRQFEGYGSIHLQWKMPGQTNFVPIDKIHLYPEDRPDLWAGTSVTQTVYCEKPDNIQAVNHHLIDSFSLISNKKMLISTWIKKGKTDCKCSNYTGIHIKVKDASGNVIAELQPKEKIIEGWQQYEAVFDVPASGDKVKLEFNAPADAVLFFDDLRLHPFNANMKSFVYDPVTLRLATELDENNYASFYEYDDDGTLVRVKKETRLGIKTITETRSATQKSITDFQ